MGIDVPPNILAHITTPNTIFAQRFPKNKKIPIKHKTSPNIMVPVAFHIIISSIIFDNKSSLSVFASCPATTKYSPRITKRRDHKKIRIVIIVIPTGRDLAKLSICNPLFVIFLKKTIYISFYRFKWDSKMH